MKKCISCLLVLVLFVTSCDDRDDNLLGPNVRIKNESTIDFSLVQVRVDSLVFNNVPSNGFSEYLEFETAFEADTIRIETDSTQYNFVPDQTSEPLPIGLYTYELNISPEGEVIFNFKVD